MRTQTPWEWSSEHQRYYAHIIGDDGRTETVWAANDTVASQSEASHRTTASLPSIGGHSYTEADTIGHETESSAVGQYLPTSPHYSQPVPEWGKAKIVQLSGEVSKAKTRPPVVPWPPPAVASAPVSELITQFTSSASLQSSQSSSARQEWSHQYQRWLQPIWDDQYQRWYWNHYIEGQGWVFFEWIPQQPAPGATQPRPVPVSISHHARANSSHYSLSSGQSSQVAFAIRAREGQPVQSTSDYTNPLPDSNYEKLDPTFYVRPKSFFRVGKMLSVLFTEPAGGTVTNYNDSVSYVKYGQAVYAQVRRFIIVRPRKEFCYAIPIFTYGNQGTKKPGVEPKEHAIAYSSGTEPTLLSGEDKLSMDPICIIMNEGENSLSIASRIFFGIYHPIQYNVKVKDLGYVHPEHLVKLIGYWAMGQGETSQAPEVTADFD
ncbi:hypothetical protein BKA66DRAFT_149712 [Pyrenochaeta sp. MPI-SDFR-AT-0127]|nr:hypothetical protein BKA66DRAFT_149712 [Pyrenochaeta sp. MPI-SDFR-AT-0127]